MWLLYKWGSLMKGFIAINMLPVYVCLTQPPTYSQTLKWQDIQDHSSALWRQEREKFILFSTEGCVNLPYTSQHLRWVVCWKFHKCTNCCTLLLLHSSPDCSLFPWNRRTIDLVIDRIARERDKRRREHGRSTCSTAPSDHQHTTAIK